MHWLFIDLGQRHDYAALAAVDELEVPYRGLKDGVIARGAEPMVTTVYELIGLDEKKGIPYPELARHTKAIMGKPELAGENAIVVDATGVGGAFADMLRDPQIVIPGTAPRAFFPICINITGGSTVNYGTDGYYNVPKTKIVDILVAVYQLERINMHTPAEMPLVARLREEVEHFTGKLTRRGQQTYSANNEEVHDDLVMCLAMGLWYAETRGSDTAGPSTRPLRPVDPAPYDPRSWLKK